MAKKGSIGLKIVADGEQEFRDAIKGIEQNMKTLGSEMKVVTSQFDKNDNSVEALTAKNNVLNKEIDEQKKKLEELQKGLKSASDKYGENDDKTQSWQRALNNATAQLNNMERQVRDNTATMNKADDTTNELGDEVKRYGKETDDAADKTISFGDVLKANLLSDAIVGGVKAIGSAIKSAFGELKQLASESMNTADEMTTLSAQTGISTEKLQEMKYVGDDLGVSLDTQTGALSKMINNMSSAKTGTGTAAEAFDTLGISVTDANGNLRDSNTVYGEVFDALGRVTNETERTAIAQDIFGKSAADLNPLIKAGSAGLADLAAQAQASGAIMSGDTVASLDALGDGIDHMKQSIQSAAGSMLGQFAPALNDISSSLTGLLNGTVSTDEFIGTITNLTSKATTAIITALPELLKAGAEILKSVVKGIVKELPNLIPAALDIIMELVNALLENLPMIIQAGLDIIVQLAFGIAEALPELIPTIIQTLLTIVDTLINNIDMLVDASIAIIMGLADGLIKSLPILIDKIPEIVDKLINAFINNYPKMFNCGIQLIWELAKGIVGCIPNLLESIGRIVVSLLEGIGKAIVKIWDKGKEIGGSFIDAIKSIDIIGAGKNLVEGLWNGIKDMVGWIKDKIAGFSEDILNGIKEFFGIASPSKLMKNEVGTFLAQGVGEGFTDTMKGVTRDMQNAIPSDFDTSVNVSNKYANAATSNQITASFDYNKMTSVFMSVMNAMGFKMVVDGEVFGTLVTNAAAKEMGAT